MEEWEVIRSKHHGTERLYVLDRGHTIGWLDLSTGQRSKVDPGDVTRFRDVLRTYSGTEADAYDTDESPIKARKRTLCGVEPWTDLSLEADLPHRRPFWLNLPGLRPPRGTLRVDDKLRDLQARGWFVLKDVPIGELGASFDRLAIGPSGVYPIQLFSDHNGRVVVDGDNITINGRTLHSLPRLRYHARMTAKLLFDASDIDAPAFPTMIFSTGRMLPDLIVKKPNPAVLILDVLDLPSALTRRDEQLSDREVGIIFDHARKSTLWHTKTTASRTPTDSLPGDVGPAVSHESSPGKPTGSAGDTSA